MLLAQNKLKRYLNKKISANRENLSTQTKEKIDIGHDISRSGSRHNHSTASRNDQKKDIINSILKEWSCMNDSYSNEVKTYEKDWSKVRTTLIIYQYV